MATIRFDTAVVAEMMEDAIKFCGKKTGMTDSAQIMEALHRGDCSICEYLHYGLAKGVAEYLGSVDDTVKAVYSYEPEYATSTDEPIRSLTPRINLIAWVSRKSAALSSVVAAMNSALTMEYKGLACPKANALCGELDVKVADDSEVQRRTGYGALIGSFHVRPIEIWQR